MEEGYFYHIYNRGIEKKDIFSDSNDYRRFLLLLNILNDNKPISVKDFLRKIPVRGPVPEIENRQNIVDIGAYCLMPNHFHLLIKEKVEGGITSFLRKLSTGYTMYFNKKYERVGPLLQGTFKAEHANSDEYLKYLFSYIHLNPIKIIDESWKNTVLKKIDLIRNFLKEYQYSSYLDYLEPLKFKSKILNKEAFPEYFSSGKDFDKTIFEWLNYSNSN